MVQYVYPSCSIQIIIHIVLAQLIYSSGEIFKTQT